MTDPNEPAFPRTYSHDGHNGLTKCEYAAIALRVPNSGDAEIDAMIRAAERRDFAAMAMQGIAATGDAPTFTQTAIDAIKYADALIAELAKAAPEAETAPDEGEIGRLRAALEPFSFFAGLLFERNFNNGDVVALVNLGDGPCIELKAGAFFKARAALKGGSGRKFKLGDRVTKIKGSQWTGRVVGFYSTELTPIGYAVESETERGSVQIYPEAALKGGEA